MRGHAFSSNWIGFTSEVEFLWRWSSTSFSFARESHIWYLEAISALVSPFTNGLLGACLVSGLVNADHHVVGIGAFGHNIEAVIISFSLIDKSLVNKLKIKRVLVQAAAFLHVWMPECLNLGSIRLLLLIRDCRLTELVSGVEHAFVVGKSLASSEKWRWADFCILRYNDSKRCQKQWQVFHFLF